MLLGQVELGEEQIDSQWRSRTHSRLVVLRMLAACSACAVLIDPFGRGHFVAMSRRQRKPFLIGRSPRSDLFIAHPGVSRKHATLRYGCDDEAFFVEDRESINGTSVAGRAVVEPVRIASGNCLEIAGIGLLLYALPPGEIAALARILERSAPSYRPLHQSTGDPGPRGEESPAPIGPHSPAFFANRLDDLT